MRLGLAAGLTQFGVNQLHLAPGATAAVDMGVAQWAFDRGEPAGRGTDTLPASACLVLPLKAPMRLRGVLAVHNLPQGRYVSLDNSGRQELCLGPAPSPQRTAARGEVPNAFLR